MDKFGVHGEFHLMTEGRILISKIRGPCNLEFTQTYLPAFETLVRSLSVLGSWAGITEFEQSALFPPESEATMRMHIAFAIRNQQMVVNCWVISPEVEGFGVMEYVGRRMHVDICPFETFENFSSAREWTLEQLVKK